MSIPRVGLASQPMSPEPCRACHKTVEKIQKCSRCLIANYCSKECQRKDWPQHKAFCTTPDQRAEKISSVIKKNEQIVASPKFLEDPEPAALALPLDTQKIENEILRLIEASPDRRVLLQLLNKVFPREKCQKKLLKSWKNLSPEVQQFRLQKYMEIGEMIKKLEEQKSSYLRDNPVTKATQLFRDTAHRILRLPDDFSFIDIDLAAWRKAAKTLLEALPLIEASPDIERIMFCCGKGVSCMVLESDLKLDWSKLPAPEAALRKQAWQKIAPYYEPCVNALLLLQNDSHSFYIPKP